MPGQQFTIIDNDGTDPVVGTFDKVPDFPGDPFSVTTSSAAEGAVVMRRRFPDFGLRITYKGGDGNDVVLTTVALPTYAVGAGPGGLPVVNVYDGTGSLARSFNAYESTFRGGVHVETADVTGDGVPDTITAPGFGGGPLIRIWDGQTGELVRQFFAYDPAFRGGANIAAANISTLEGSGLPNIITGAGPGGGPHVKVFDVTTLNTVADFFAFDPALRGGVTVAGVSAAGSGFATRDPLVIAGAGPGYVPVVRVFDGMNGTPRGIDFMAYDPGFRGGVSVAWDGGAGINTAPGAGSPPLVRVFSFNGTLARQFLAYDARFLGGVTLATHLGRIVTGPGPGGGPHVREWFINDLRLSREFFAFDPALRGGVFVE